MSKITIIESNSNNKDQTRNYIIKGERGYSAYDIYVQNGGTLTEEEWVDAFLSADNYYSKSQTDIKLLAKIDKTEIVDNLTSTSISKPLSANQGKVLKELIDNVYTKTESDSNYQSKVLSGTADPSSNLGEDGDVYFQYES